MNGMNGACFQDRSQMQPQDNCYLQNNNHCQGEPDCVPEQAQCNDGFFNQDAPPTEEYPANEDGFYNQEDSFFEQDQYNNYDDNGIDQHDAYEVSA